MKEKIKAFNVDLFNEIYNEAYGEIEVVKLDYTNFLNFSKFQIQVLSVFYNNELSKTELIDNYDVKFSSSNFQELKEKGYLEITKKEGKKEFYKLSEFGLKFFKDYIGREFIAKNNYITENRIRARKNSNKEFKLNSDDPTKELIKKFYNYSADNLKMHKFLQEGNFTLDLLKMQEVDYNLVDMLIENYEETFALFQEVLKTFLSIEDSDEWNNIKDNIKFKGLDKITTQYYKIDRMPTDTTEFIHTEGLLTHKSSKIKEETVYHKYICSNPNCRFGGDKGNIKAPSVLKACPACKSGLELIEEKKSAVLTLEIRDIETESAIKVKVYNNLIKEFSDIRIGEEINIFGHLQYLQQKKEPHQRVTYERCLILNNFSLSNNTVSLTKEEKKEVSEFVENLQKKDTIENFLLNPIKKQFKNYPDEIFRFVLLPQLLRFQEGEENLFHLLLIGSPDTAKTSFLKVMSNLFPKKYKILMKNLSEAKFYGGVKGDGLTDVGVVMKQREGTLILDEIDKDNEAYDKSANMLNEVLEEQTATKDKVGISIKLTDINIRVYGIMNHHPYKDEFYKPLDWIMKNIHISTLTRFFLVDFDYFVKDEQKDFIIENDVNNGLAQLKDVDWEIRKKLVLYTRSLNVDISDIALELIHFSKSVRQATANYETASRNIKQIKNLIVALTRLKGNTKATVEEFEEAKKLIFWSFKTQGMTLNDYADISKENVKRINLVGKDGNPYKVIKGLFKNNDSLTLENIRYGVKEFGFSNSEILNTIERLKKNGDVYEPRKDSFRIVNK